MCPAPRVSGFPAGAIRGEDGNDIQGLLTETPRRELASKPRHEFQSSFNYRDIWRYSRTSVFEVAKFDVKTAEAEARKECSHSRTGRRAGVGIRACQIGRSISRTPMNLD
jgi:hypothetical protein